MTREKSRDETLGETGEHLELASDGSSLETGAMTSEVLGGLSVSGQAVTLADHRAGELGFVSTSATHRARQVARRGNSAYSQSGAATHLRAETVGVLGQLDELVRVQVDASGGSTATSISVVRGVDVAPVSSQCSGVTMSTHGKL